MRSLLFVPGDSPRKLEKSLEVGADALIIDLEDSVAQSAKDAARKGAHDFVRATRALAKRPLLIVRVNALDSGLIEDDLDSVMPAAPDAIMLPKSRHGADVQHASVKIAVREARNGLVDGATKIIPIATETADAIFGLSSYAGSSARLLGLTWGAEDLAAALGAETNRLSDGSYADPYRLARALTLFAAHSADVEPIDTVYANFRDMNGLRLECEAARRDGFVAKMAIHLTQVAVINEVFTPSPGAVAHARKIVEAFAKNPDAGVLNLDGAMIDRPHLRQAERVLGRVGGSAGGKVP
jgi:citrate lyase subunit beta/citryl-CoA lyase